MGLMCLRLGGWAWLGVDVSKAGRSACGTGRQRPQCAAPLCPSQLPSALPILCQPCCGSGEGTERSAVQSPSVSAGGSAAWVPGDFCVVPRCGQACVRGRSVPSGSAGLVSAGLSCAVSPAKGPSRPPLNPGSKRLAACWMRGRQLVTPFLLVGWTGAGLLGRAGRGGGLLIWGGQFPFSKVTGTCSTVGGRAQYSAQAGGLADAAEPPGPPPTPSLPVAPRARGPAAILAISSCGRDRMLYCSHGNFLVKNVRKQAH